MCDFHSEMSHDELIAEIRERQDLRGGDLVDNFHIEDGEYGEWSGLELLKAYAECLDKAHKREIVEAATKAATDAINLTEEKWRRECADMAKLREALVCLRDAAREFHHQILNSKYNHILDKYTCEKQGFSAALKVVGAIVKANYAIAAPARNCDVFAPEVLLDQFINEMPEEVEKKITKRERDLIELTAKGVIGTLFAPYKPIDESEDGEAK